MKLPSVMGTGYPDPSTQMGERLVVIGGHSLVVLANTAGSSIALVLNPACTTRVRIANSTRKWKMNATNGF